MIKRGLDSKSVRNPKEDSGKWTTTRRLNMKWQAGHHTHI